MRGGVPRLVVAGILVVAVAGCAGGTTVPSPTATPTATLTPTPTPTPTPSPTPTPQWMGDARPMGDALEVKVEDLRFTLSPSNPRRADLCVGGALTPTDGTVIQLIDAHISVLADEGELFSSYRIEPDDFRLVDEAGEVHEWDQDACGLSSSAFMPMLGTLQYADFGITFSIPEETGQTWLRYQPHDTNLDVSWSVPAS